MKNCDFTPGCLTGRFQPFHLGHLELFLQVVKCHRQIYVAITNPTPESRSFESTNPNRHLSESNPFSFKDRVAFIESVLTDNQIDRERVVIVPFSLTEPASWYLEVPPKTVRYVRVFSPWEKHKVKVLKQKYKVEILPTNTSSPPIRATVIREAIKSNSPWTHLVPSGVASLIRSSK